jgi:hypothetical protein
MLGVAIKSIMLSVIGLNATVLSVMAPYKISKPIILTHII